MMKIILLIIGMGLQTPSSAEQKRNVKKVVKKKVIVKEVPDGEVAIDPSGNTRINLGETSLMGDQDSSESLEIVAPGTEILNNKVKDRKHFNDRTYMDVLKIR